jgi:GDPmannose 4,6-dehydratase
MSTFHNLALLGIRDRVHTESMAPNDFRSVLQVLVKVKPDELYNLAGQSSVGLSFQQPVETLESISVATLNLLEAIRFINLPIRLYNAGSSEVLVTAGLLLTRRRRSGREVRMRWRRLPLLGGGQLPGGLRDLCCSILFNRRVSLAARKFATKRLSATACRIAEVVMRSFSRNISIARDWDGHQSMLSDVAHAAAGPAR